MNQKEFYKQWDEELSPNLFSFAIEFNQNPDDETLVLKFIEENRLIISEKLATSLKNHIDNSFNVETWHRKFRLLPNFIKVQNIEKYILVKKYFSKKIHFVSFIKSYKLYENDLSLFFNACIDYPMKCRYQDIFCFSKKNNITVIISHHADVYICSNQKDYLYSLYKIFQNEFEFVVPDDNFKKYINDNTQ